MKKLLTIFGMLMLLINAVAAAVVITPDNPDTDDKLTCDVSGSDATYNYYWYVDGSRVRLETARSSTLAASQTSGGDEVICRAYRPSTPFTPESYVGRDVVTIKYVLTTPGMFVAVNPQLPIGYPDDGYGEEYNPPEYPDDGYGEEYNPPTFPDDGDIDVYNPPGGFPDDGDIDVYVPPQGFPDDGDIDVYVPTPLQCSDNADNDGDGLVDMADPGCTNPNDDDETNVIDVPQCSDNADNDGDGLIDMNDPGCSTPLDDDERNFVPNPEAPAQCNDGMDNDNDGLADMEDPGCTIPQDNSEDNPAEPEPNTGSGARSLNLEMVYAVVDGDNLKIEYILANDGTMPVKGVELQVNVPDYGLIHIEDIGKMSMSRKIYGFATVKLPENAEGTHLVLAEATGLGAHDSEQRTFSVENNMANGNSPNIEVLVFVPDAQATEKGFFARIVEWFLNLFRAVFNLLF